MKNTLICNGCDANLERARGPLELEVLSARLSIRCPLCKYSQLVGFDLNGNVFTVEDNNNDLTDPCD